MRFHVRLISALAPVCLLTALFTPPRSAEAQNPSQVHPITGLPLPPDEDTPAVATPATPAPVVAAPAPGRHPATKTPRKATPAPVTLPAATPAPVAEPVQPLPTPTPAAPTPAVEPTPAAATPAEKRRARRERAPKPEAVAAPAPEGNTIHAIKLPPPPDEEPAASTPQPAAPTPKPVAAPPLKSSTPKPAAPQPAPPAPKLEAPKPAPKAQPAPDVAPVPKPIAVKPVPLVKPITNPDVTPAPETAKPAPAPKPETPRTEAPKPVVTTPPPPARKPEAPKPEAAKPAAPRPSALEPTPPTNRLPIAPVSVPTTAPAGATVAAPKTVVVPSSIVPDEPPPPAPAVTPKAKPAKPQPTLKSRGASSPVIVTMPSSNVAKPSATPAAPAPAPVEAPAPPPPGTLAHIVFQGAEPYTQAELAPLTGLALGTSPTNESLQTASSRLIGTGLFSNVRASYDTPNDLGVATFVLEPLPPSQLARVSFANLVWLTPAEIDDTVKALPLYRGVIPMSGNVMMADSIQAALQSALSTHGVQATLTHMLIPPSPQHPYTAMEFRVTSPNVVLASASLFDIPPALVNRTLKAQTDAVKVPYNEGIAGTTLSDLLLAPAHNAGYIGARLWHIERKRHVLNRTTTSVDFVARMDAGPIYTVHSLHWTPSPVLSEADFHRQAALHVGQVPTTDAADKTQQAITDAYFAQGYLEATVSATQNLDPKTGAADYTYSAVPGPQYRLGSISVHGLSPDALKDFDEAWTMKLGDVYNDGYLLNFLNAHQNIASLKGYTFTYDRSIPPDTHNVDLTLTFKK